MEIDRLLNQIDNAGIEITRKLSNRIKEGLDPSLSHSHIYLLMFIKHKENCIVTDIANYLGVTLSAVTGLINKLDNMGLVTRDRNEKDRRIVHIKLTEEGRKVLEKVDENRKRLYEKYFACLSPEEIEIYFKLISKISENIIELDERKVK